MTAEVHLVGNANNMLFGLANVLRNETDHRVVLWTNHCEPYINWPENDDSSLAGAYPSWIREHSSRKMLLRIMPAAEPLVRELKSADVVVLSGAYAAISPKLHSRTIFWAGGTDLTRLPWGRHYPEYALPRFPASLHRYISAQRQRRGIRAMDRIAAPPFAPFRSALAALGITWGSDQWNGYLPLALNPQTSLAGGSQHTAHLVDKLSNVCEFVVFCPARLIDRASPAMVRSGEWKNSSALIRGFATFVARLPVQSRPGVKLAIIDRAYSQDAYAMKSLADDLGIGRHVLSLQGPDNRGFSREDLWALYAWADVVADDFGVGWFGNVALEGLSSGKPVLTHVDDAVMQTLYGSNPFVEAKTTEDIAIRLTELYEDSTLRRRLGEFGQYWLNQHHSSAEVAGRFEQLISA